MAGPRGHGRRRAAVATVAVLMAVLAWHAAWSASAGSRTPPRAQAHDHASHGRAEARRLRLHRRALRRYRRARRERVRLWAAVRRHPEVVLTRRFRARAADARLDMPLTVRLNPKIDDDGDFSTPAVDAPSNDRVRIDWGADPIAAPAGPGVGAGAQEVTLSGSFGLTARWGKDTIGYSTGRSVVEVGSGAVAMQATPVEIVDPVPACPDGSALLESGPISISQTPNWTRTGILGLMGGPFRLRLYTQWTFNALRQGSFAGPPPSPFGDGCGGAFFWTGHIGVTAPPVPIDFRGSSTISPALTTDGRLRLFSIHVHDAVIAQDDDAATFHVCAVPDPSQTPEGSPPPAADCTGEAGDDTMLPATVKVLDFDAEVLIGRPD